MPFHKVNNLNIHYKSQGEGETIIFIHGLGSSSLDWQKQIFYFSKKYHTVTYDIRGHGQSDKSSNSYNIEVFTSDLIKLITKLGINKAHIVGISMGGMIACQLTTQKPELVKSLTMVNSIPEFVLKDFKQKTSFFLRAWTVKILGMKFAARLISKKLFPKKDQSILRSAFIKRWQSNNKNAYYQSLKNLLNWNVADKISKITCPTLFISGDRDYISIELKQDYISQILNGKLAIIKDSGHAVSVEKSKEFNQILESFLKK